MKSRSSLLLIMVAIFFTIPTYAQIKNRLELGVGGMQSTQYIDYLVRVSNTLTLGEESEEDDFFIMVKVNSDVGFNMKSIPYLDFSFEIAPSVDINDDGQSRLYLGYNLLTLKQQKNIDIDLANQFNLSVVGFRLGGHQELSDGDIKLFGQISLDFLGVVFDSQRASDVVGLSSKEYGKRASDGLNVFLGLSIKEKFRIVFGLDILNTYALGTNYVSGETCNDYYDDWGDYLGSECHDTVSTQYDERWESHRYYIETSYNLSKSLSVFGRAQYSIFKMTDDTQYFPSSQNKQWQFMFGAKYRLFSSN